MSRIMNRIFVEFEFKMGWNCMLDKKWLISLADENVVTIIVPPVDPNNDFTNLRSDMTMANLSREFEIRFLSGMITSMTGDLLVSCQIHQIHVYKVHPAAHMRDTR